MPPSVGPRECGNISNFPAELLEQAVWDEVHELIRDPHRLQAAYYEELERRRKAQREDPEREIRALTEEIGGLDRKRAAFQDQQAEGLMTLDELGYHPDVLRRRREKAEAALEEARGRAERMESLRRELYLVFARGEQIRTMKLRFLHPEDKRRVLMASRTKADIDRDGDVTITGLLNLDIARLLPTDGMYRTDREGREPAPYEKGVVGIGNVPSLS